MESVDCIFCNPSPEHVVLKNDVAYVRFDAYPVSPGHLLVVPIRHFPSVFDATDEEIAGLWYLVRQGKDLLQKKYRPDGFNIGVNVGLAAGQTIMHAHIHVIPRYHGDVIDPRGGVRGVIHEKQRY